MCRLPKKHSETLEELNVALGLFIPIGEIIVPGEVGLPLCGALLEQCSSYFYIYVFFVSALQGSAST